MAHKPLALLLLAVSFLCSSVVSGQAPPMRAQPSNPMGRPPFMGGAPGAMGPWSGSRRPGSRDMRRRGGDRFSRMEGFLRSMDANGDGTIQQSEVSPMHQGMYRMMSMRLGQDPSKGLSIQKLRETMTGRRGPGRRGDGRTSSAQGKKDASGKKPGQPEAEPLVPGFGNRPESVLVAGFGAATTGRIVLGTADAEARATLSRHDRNRNGVLDQKEWSGLGRSAYQIDRNRDGKITLGELISGPAQSRRGSWRNQGPGYPGMDDAGDENETQSDSTATGNKRRSYRFLSAHERLPEGLPGWFVARDTDLDGQVTMAEFARDWNRWTLTEYRTYDENNDGIITPKECLRAGGTKRDATADVKTDTKTGAKAGGTKAAPPPGGSSKGGESKPWWLQ